MRPLLADVGTIAQLMRRSLVGASVHGYWRDLAAHRESQGAGGLVVRGVAGVVYATLLPIVPLLAMRRRRLVGRALEAVVRAIVAGVEVPTAVDRAVAWLSRKGLDAVQARADIERLLAGFLSSSAVSSESREASSDLKSVRKETA
jgi:hypothetical protein